ncbi:hypothetical protein AB0M46_28645 [Dactylosporangium sp. NPDC051485]|uniref:hypothetical protein n=1 Tax=Dactylosporangium sp. NPDC051485 TaxID=3154846 RepID=UPI00342EC0FA
MIFYPDGFELYVDNPGHGELFVVAATEPWNGDPLVHQEWRLDLYGSELGEFLARVTDRALDTDQAWPGRVRLPAFITSAVAATLLPALQRATMLAIGGSDRYERTFPETDEAPAGPLCVRCNLGTPYPPGALPSTWCEQHGHRAYGVRPGRWDLAQELHGHDLAMWQREQARERDRAAWQSRG